MGRLIVQVRTSSNTPVANARVTITSVTTPDFRQTQTTGADGNGTFVAPAGDVAITAHDPVSGFGGATVGRVQTDQERTATVTVGPVGSVRGVVVQADGVTPVSGIVVQLVKFTQAEQIVITDADGSFRFEDVAPNPYTVTVVDSQRRARARRAIQLAQAEVEVVVTLVLGPVPVADFYDANDFRFDVGSDGSVMTGTANVYADDAATHQRGVSLGVEVEGAVIPFVGTESVTGTEENGREVVVAELLTPTLTVTRKVFVPVDGYFTRYVEVLRNTSETALAVAVQLTSHFRSFPITRNSVRIDDYPRVVSTSSGDDVLSIVNATNRDRWALIDDSTELDPFVSANLPAMAHIFDGEGGVVRTETAGFTQETANRFARMTQQWQQVTIPPNETVALLHFVVHQVDRAAALASIERLSQLPPEALVGLSVEERADIRNFVVPADGSSFVAPLPGLGGTVNGQVLAENGTTPVTAAQVSFKSQSPLFARTYTTTSNATGNFTFAGNRSATVRGLAVPLEAFTLGAVHPQTRATAPAVSGTLSPTQRTVTRNIAFTSTGAIQGTVRTANGTVVSNGIVQASGDTLVYPLFVPLNADGTYRLTGLPPGTYVLVGTYFPGNGGGITGTTTTFVGAGQTVTADITVSETGSVVGRVTRSDGSSVVDAEVQLSGSGFWASARTDTGGRFVLPTVPVGTYTLEAWVLRLMPRGHGVFRRLRDLTGAIRLWIFPLCVPRFSRRRTLRM